MQHTDTPPPRAPREVTQSILHGDPSGLPGDCVRAAVASLLDLDPASVPHFVCGSEDVPGLWEHALRGWALMRGWQITRRFPDPSTPAEEIELPAFGLACGPSERGVSHAVVAIDGRIAWDPHPSRAGIIRPKELIHFTRAKVVPDGEPTESVFEVAAFTEHDEPLHRALFTARAVAEDYKARLPGGELEEVPLLAAAPRWVMEHRIEKFVTTRKGVSFSGLAPEKTTMSDRWSHEVNPAPGAWSHPDHHVRIQATDHDCLKLVSILAFTESAARHGMEAAEARLKAEEKLARLEDVRVETWTSGPYKRARATHLPTGLVAEAEGPGCEYEARGRLQAMVTAAPAPGGRYTTLASSAAVGDEELALNAPVPTGSWILVSPRSGHTERVPVYACLGAGPYTVLLGILDPAAPGARRIARLAETHPAGDPVEVCDA